MSVVPISVVSTDEKLVEQANQKGAQIYQKNKSIQGLTNLYYHPLMQDWIKENGHTWQDWTQLVMYMETMHSIKQFFQESFQREPTPFETIFFFQQALANGDSRKFIVEQFSKWREGDISTMIELEESSLKWVAQDKGFTLEDFQKSNDQNRVKSNTLGTSNIRGTRKEEEKLMVQ